MILLLKLLESQVGGVSSFQLRVRVLRRFVFILGVEHHLMKGFARNPEIARKQVFFRTDIEGLNKVLISLQLLKLAVGRTVRRSLLL